MLSSSFCTMGWTYMFHVYAKDSREDGTLDGKQGRNGLFRSLPLFRSPILLADISHRWNHAKRPASVEDSASRTKRKDQNGART